MVKTYSVKTQGSLKLSNNFTVSEFACKDGSDKVLIDTDLVDVLQKIRDHFGKPVKINSAYRTVSWNAKQGGSSSSYHCKGMAADIKIEGVSAVEIAYFAQTVTNGVGAYYYGTSDFVHVDTRPTVKHWLCAKAGKYEYYNTDLMPTIKKGSSKSTAVKFVQKKLGISIDGKFGSGTRSSVIKFQQDNGLTADGVVGKNTWTKMFC